jgi:hypothetical protein
LSFSLDPGWVQSIGEEATVNRELEGVFWEFMGGRHNDDGTFKIPTRGPAIEKLADILEYWLEKYPATFRLQKWIRDATASASAVILAHKQIVHTRLSHMLPYPD